MVRVWIGQRLDLDRDPAISNLCSTVFPNLGPHMGVT